MEPTMQDYPLVEIVWADHFSEFEDGYNLEQLLRLIKAPSIRKTVGYLAAENSRMVAIAGTIEEDGTFSEVFCCMKKCIISRSDKKKGA